MAEVDVSSYGRQPAPVNPLQMLSGAAGLQNTINQNKLFQQQFGANVALSDAARAATDADGNFHPDVYRAKVAAGPAGYKLPEAIAQSQQVEQGKIGIDQNKYNLLKDHLTTLTGYLGPLAAGNPTANDVASTIGYAITAGVATPQEGASMWATLPRDASGNVDQTQIRTWAQNNLQRVQAAGAQYGITNPAPQAVSTGGQMHLLVTPQNGPARDVGQIANTLPPTTSTVGPGNVPQALGPQTSQLQVPGAQPAPVPVPAPGVPAPAPDAAQPSPLAGAIPGLAASPAAATPGAPPGDGRVQTGLPPGVADAAAVTAHASAQQGVQLQQAADQIPQQKAILDNLSSALNRFTAGPGADWRKVAGAFANVPLQALGLKGVGASNVASQEEFDKLATNLAQSQFATLGGTGTDAKLDSAMHTSPNSALSKMGNQNIIALLKGNADAIAAKNQAWQKFAQDHGPQSYGQFSTEFNKSYNPRVFQSVYMSPKDRAEMVKDLSKPELAKFRDQFNTAVQQGWIPDPRQANAGR